jgi:hypothetical protein
LHCDSHRAERDGRPAAPLEAPSQQQVTEANETCLTLLLSEMLRLFEGIASEQLAYAIAASLSHDVA